MFTCDKCQKEVINGTSIDIWIGQIWRHWGEGDDEDAKCVGDLFRDNNYWCLCEECEKIILQVQIAITLILSGHEIVFKKGD